MLGLFERAAMVCAMQAATISYLQGLMEKTKGTPEELTINMIVPFLASEGHAAQWEHLRKGFDVRWCNLRKDVTGAKQAGSGSAGASQEGQAWTYASSKCLCHGHPDDTSNALACWSSTVPRISGRILQHAERVCMHTRMQALTT